VLVSTAWYSIVVGEARCSRARRKKKTLDHNRSVFVQHSIQLPKARKEKLIIKELADETLVYDLENDKAHCLNQTAACVWKYCDGKRSISEIGELMSKNSEAPVGDEIVLLALDQLQKFALLETNNERAFQLAGMNRRELVRRVGLGALALPIILSIASPTAAQVGSAGSLNHCCGNPADCNPGLTCQQSACLTPPPAQPSSKACLP
jgi:hypothetical protein